MISDELEVLKIVVQRLADSGINYMVSGSVAGNFYSQPRMTRDIDMVIQLSRFEVDKIYHLFEGDFYIERDSIVAALKDRGMFNIIHNEKVIKIDFIIAAHTEYEKVKFQRRVLKDIEGINLFLISLEDLILSKLLWAKDSRSELQLNDVKNLTTFDREGLDLAYLENWADTLSVKTLLKECL